MILSKHVDLIQWDSAVFAFKIMFSSITVLQRKCINCFNANKVRVINLIEQM